MKAREFRKRFDAELERSTAAGPAPRGGKAETTDDLVAEVTNRGLDARRRVDTVGRAAETAVKRPQLMEALIALIGDPDEDPEVRGAALSAVQASTFKTLEFRRYGPDYNDALRVAATDDDADLRAQALGVLALNKDPYAQQLLLDGLRDAGQSLVGPVEAVRMLGNDVHAELFPVLRQLVEESTQPALRREALRVLAADSGSVELMRDLAGNREEDEQARATAAIALQSLAPTEFAELARELVLDDDDSPDLRASVISALARSTTPASQDVAQKVRELDAAPSANPTLDRAARQFMEAQ